MNRHLFVWPQLVLLCSSAWCQEEVQDALPEDSAPGESAPLMLDLQQALELAMQNNLTLRLAEVDSEIANYDHLGSWGEFEWRFNATASYSDSDREVNSAFLSGGSTISTQDERLVLDLSKPLTTGGNLGVNFDINRQESNSTIVDAERLTSDALAITFTQPLRRQAWEEYATSVQRERELAWRRQVELQRQSRQDLVFSVSTAYWNMVAAVEEFQVSLSARDLAEELLTRRRRELEAGVGTEVEVLESQAEVATREETVLLTQNAAGERSDELKTFLLGSSDEALWGLQLELTTPLPESTDFEPPVWTEALLTAIELRSELRQLRLAADIARQGHTRTLSERLAGVDLSLTASSGAVDENPAQVLSDTFEWDFPTWTVALTYDMPIGNRVADYAERAARANIRRVLLEYDNQEVIVVADVRKAVRDVLFRAEAVRAAVTTLALSTRQLEAEKARNEQGLSTNFQVLEVQQSYVEALFSERRARAEYAKALVELEQAQGLLGESGSVK